MRMLYVLVVGIVVAVVGAIVAMKFLRAGAGVTDIEILRVDFTPPDGSEVRAGMPIACEIHYRYSKPRLPLLAWAQLRGNPGSTYEPSIDEMQPGTGSVRREVTANEPGEITTVTISGRDERSRVEFEHVVAVHFTVAPDPELERLLDDGVGARVTDVRLTPPSGSTLKPGEMIHVEVDYEVESERGLHLWAMPLDGDGSNRYCSSEDSANGTGTCRRWIIRDKPGEIRDIMISMANVAGQRVFSERVRAVYLYR
jgi:hypothetical protein